MTGSPTHVFFGLPCFGGQVTEAFFTSFLKLQLALPRWNLPYSLQTIVNESLVTRARNTLVAHFLARPEATHLMFIDVDIRFEPESVLKLLKHDKDIVGAAYPKKALDWAQIKERAATTRAELLPIAGAEYAVNLVGAPSRETLVEVKDLATGFLLVKREVILRMIQGFPHLKYRNTMVRDPRYMDLFYALFDTSIDNDGAYLSEDYTFCRRWQSLGGKIFLDQSISLDHIGSFSFSGHPLVQPA